MKSYKAAFSGGLAVACFIDTVIYAYGLPDAVLPISLMVIAGVMASHTLLHANKQWEN